MRRWLVSFLAAAFIGGSGGGTEPQTGPSPVPSGSTPLVVVSGSGQLGEGLDLFVDTDRR